MVAMDLGENNIQLMKRYEELVNEHHKQPVNWLFDDIMALVIKALVSDESESNMEVDVGLRKFFIFF